MKKKKYNILFHTETFFCISEKEIFQIYDSLMINETAVSKNM